MPRLLNSLRQATVMFRTLVRLRRDERGISAVEFAFVLPIMVLLGVGLTELGRVVKQATTVQKSLRAGAIYAARNQFPLTAAVKTTTENLVKKGDPTGAGEFLVPGWSKSGADFALETPDFDLNGTPLPVVRLTATVPFVPMLPGLLPIPSFNLVLRHEQAFVGN